MTRREFLRVLLMGGAGLLAYTGGLIRGLGIPPLRADTPQITRRRLGKTELKVSMLSFGAGYLREDFTPYRQSADALHQALDLGMNFIDTAPNYGESERWIGRALHGRREQFYLATKTNATEAGPMERQLTASLRALRTDHIDLYQFHALTREGWDAIRARGGAYQAAEKAREEGKIGHIGVSIHRDKQLMHEAIASGLFETVQLEYNLVDSEDLGDEILPMAREADLGIICMKLLSAGALCPPPEKRVAGLGGPDAIIAGSVRFVLGNPNVDCGIIGMQSVEHVEQHVALAKAFEPLTEAERRRLYELVGQADLTLRSGACLRCGYCLPCPLGIDIVRALVALYMDRHYGARVPGQAEGIWRGLEVSPRACTGCGECTKRCPANLNIPELLEEAVERFEG